MLRLINFAHSEVFMLGMFGQYATLMLLGFYPSGNAYDKGIALTVLYLGIAMLGGMLVAGGAAVGLERVAYRPLRRRGAPALVFLITAIGMSFIIQEFVHFVLPKLTGGTLGGVNAQQPIRLVQPEVQFTIGGAPVTNITLVIILSALVLALATDMFINRTNRPRHPRRRAGPGDRDPHGRLARARHHADVPHRRHPRRRGRAALHAARAERDHLLRRLHPGIKAFCAAVLGGIGNLRGALLGGLLLGVMENYGQVVFGTEWRDVVAFALLIIVLMFRPTGILGESLGRARA